jgi:hypothetical protein
MPNHWYIARGGVREGPIAEDILLGWAADGSLRPHDLVWREGLETWARADAVPGLLAPPPLPTTVVESSTPGPPPSAGRKSPPSGMLYVLLALNFLTCLVPTVWLLAVDSLDAFPDLSGFTWARLLLGSLALALLVGPATALLGWREATRVGHRSRRPRFAATVKVALAAEMFVLAFLALLYVAQNREAISLAFGREHLKGGQVRVLGDGEEIELIGPMQTDISNQVRALLASHANVQTLRLSSVGGRLREARRIARIIKERNLRTYCSDYCASACAAAFVAGSEKILKNGARLGFHGATLRGADPVYEKAATKDYLRMLADAGASEDFLHEVQETPPEKMWYPSNARLLSEGLVDRITDGHDFAPATFEPDADDLDGDEDLDTTGDD